MNSHEVFIHIHQGCFAGTGAIVRLPQCQWSKPDGYGKISQCITTTKHSKAKTVCIFLGIYCTYPWYEFGNYWLRLQPPCMGQAFKQSWHAINMTFYSMTPYPTMDRCIVLNMKSFIDNNAWTWVSSYSCPQQDLNLVVISRVTKPQWKWMQNNFHERTYQVGTTVHTLFILLHDILTTKITIKQMIFTHRVDVSIAPFMCLFSGDDVTMDYKMHCGTRQWLRWNVKTDIM